MYAALTYRADVRELAELVEVPRPDAGERRRVPVLLGTDVLGAPYEVLDVELVDVNGRLAGSRVHLGPASAETRRGNRARYLDQRAAGAELALEHARVRHFWRPDLWPPVADDQAGDVAARLAATELAKASA